jgi:hypothetical protein
MPLNKLYQGTSDDKPIYITKGETKVPVPKSKAWRNEYRIRKITFSNSNDVNNNPAPDPVLLLGKAASNWLKRHGLVVLPSSDTNDYDSL